MYEIGRICIKLAGRDAGKEAVIVDILDDRFVLIDGNVRRRKCNIFHLEPTGKKVEIKKNASHDEVAKVFADLGFSVWNTKSKSKTERPKKIRGKKQKAIAQTPKETKKKEKAAKKVVKDAEVVEEKKEKKAVKEETTESSAEKKPARKKAVKKE
jgi:large subunit ribosomal protein L14e